MSEAASKASVFSPPPRKPFAKEEELREKRRRFLTPEVRPVSSRALLSGRSWCSPLGAFVLTG
jgi:hypothetical protein